MKEVGARPQGSGHNDFWYFIFEGWNLIEVGQDCHTLVHDFAFLRGEEGGLAPAVVREAGEGQGQVLYIPFINKLKPTLFQESPVDQNRC